MNSARIIIPWTLGALGAGIALAGALVAYCPTPCRELWPLMEIANWTNLLLGLLAAIALALQLRQTKAVRQFKAAS